MNKIYIKIAGSNILVNGQSCPCVDRKGLGMSGIRELEQLPDTLGQIYYLAQRGLCCLLPGKPIEAGMNSYDTREIDKGARDIKAKEGMWSAPGPDGGPCGYPAEKGSNLCFRHMRLYRNGI